MCCLREVQFSEGWGKLVWVAPSRFIAGKGLRNRSESWAPVFRGDVWQRHHLEQRCGDPLGTTGAMTLVTVAPFLLAWWFCSRPAPHSAHHGGSMLWAHLTLTDFCSVFAVYTEGKCDFCVLKQHRLDTFTHCLGLLPQVNKINALSLSFFGFQTIFWCTGCFSFWGSLWTESKKTMLKEASENPWWTKGPVCFLALFGESFHGCKLTLIFSNSVYALHILTPYFSPSPSNETHFHWPWTTFSHTYRKLG